MGTKNDPKIRLGIRNSGYRDELCQHPTYIKVESRNTDLSFAAVPLAELTSVPISNRNTYQNDTELTHAYIMSDSFPPRIVADMKPTPRPR